MSMAGHGYPPAPLNLNRGPWTPLNAPLVVHELRCYERL